MARDRGKPFEAPWWWLEIARPFVEDAKGLTELGQKLAKRAGRATPWSHTVLSKFANGETPPTQELAAAISDHFDIPRPFYIPRNYAEARLMQDVAALQATPTKKQDSVRSARERQHIEQLEELEGEVARHSTQLQSDDAVSRRSRSRGARRVHRGG